MTFISILVCLLFKTYIYIITSNELIAELWNLKSLIANFGLLFAGYPYFEMMGINNPVWYVCVLIQCYVIYYFLEFLINSIILKVCILSRLAVYLIISFFLILLHHSNLLNEASFRGLISFFIGCSIFLINVELRQIISINKNVIALVLLLTSILSWRFTFLGIDQRWVLSFFTFPLLVLGVANLKISDCRSTSKLGAISFEVYLFHYPLMVLFQLMYVIFDAKFQSVIHSYLTMFSFLIFSWFIGWGLWKYIDLKLQSKVRY